VLARAGLGGRAPERMALTQEERERLRATFDQAAELYDRARPRYPPALFDDLAGLAGIGPGWAAGRLRPAIVLRSE
jgi:hypothetical protein